MAEPNPITRELDFGEVISRTFNLFQQDFVKYVLIYAVIELILGVVSYWAGRAFPLPILPVDATPQEALDWFPGFLSAVVTLLIVTGITGLILTPLATGTVTKIASDRLAGTESSVVSGVGLSARKLPYLWVALILSGLATAAGVLALIVPGIILYIMFSLAVPAIVLENRGPLQALGRSKELVGHRWLKSFAIYLVVGIIVGLLTLVGNLVGEILAPAGFGGIAGTLISAFFAPLTPIMMTVYYYSNSARIAPPPPPAPDAPTTPTPMM